jgi:thiol-disulfide isomerase/thioredoxin
MRILILISCFVAFIPSRDQVKILPVDYQTLVERSVDFDNTIIYLWTPHCSPCVAELKKLGKIKTQKNQHLVLLTLKNQDLEILKKFGFDTSYYFDPQIYKTHTPDYDEFNQFTEEILKGAPVKNKERAVYPAVFIINNKKQLVYFSEDPDGKIDTATIHSLLKK